MGLGVFEMVQVFSNDFLFVGRKDGARLNNALWDNAEENQANNLVEPLEDIGRDRGHRQHSTKLFAYS